MKKHCPSPQGWTCFGAELGRALLLIHLVLSPLLFSNDTAEAFEYPKVALATLTAIILAALGLSAWIAQTETPLRTRLAAIMSVLREPIAAGFLLFLASAVVSTFASINPRLSVYGTPSSQNGLIAIASYTVLFFATRWLCRAERDARQLLTAAVIGSMVSSAYAVVQVIRVDPIAWDQTSPIEGYVRPFAMMGHPNFLAAYLVMAFPVLWYFADRAAKERRWFCVAVVGMGGILSGLILLSALSRGAWLAFACVMVALCVGWAMLGKGRRITVWCGAVLTVALAGFLLAGHITPRGHDLMTGLAVRVHQFTEGNSRRHIWGIALGLFRDRPLVGCGLDTFQLAFAQKRTVAYWETEWNTTPLRAHNEALQVLATQGVLGLGAWLFLVVGLVVTAIRAWRRSNAERRILLIVLAAGILGFYVQNCFSFTVAGLATLFVTFAALLSRFGTNDQIEQQSVGAMPTALGGHGSIHRPMPTQSRGHGTLQRPWCVGFLASSLIIAAILLYNIVQACGHVGVASLLGVLSILLVLLFAVLAVWRLEARDGDVIESERISSPPVGVWMRGLQAGIWLTAALLVNSLVVAPWQASAMSRLGDRCLMEDVWAARIYYEQAIRREPENPLFWSRLGDSAKIGLPQVAAPEDRRRLLERSRDAFLHASALVPEKAYYHAGLGRVLMELARLHAATPEEAYRAYDRSLALDPNNALYYADAASAALILEDAGRARAYAEKGDALYPHFGMLRAQRAYAAMLEKHYVEANELLVESLVENWYEERPARAFAIKMQQLARRKMGP